MTTLINYISGVVNFIATPNGITQAIGNNSTLASTTAFVQTYILDLVNLITPPTIVATVNFASVRTSLLAGSITSAVNLVIQGSTIALGKLGGTLNIMGNNVPITSTFQSTVVSLTSNSRIQAGNFTPSGTSTTYTYPQSFTSTSVVIPTQTGNSTCGTQAPSGATVSIRVLSISIPVNWVAFGN
jgi:hypothetical protein